jgi:hypothetical protein
MSLLGGSALDASCFVRGCRSIASVSTQGRLALSKCCAAETARPERENVSLDLARKMAHWLAGTTMIFSMSGNFCTTHSLEGHYCVCSKWGFSMFCKDCEPKFPYLRKRQASPFLATLSSPSVSCGIHLSSLDRSMFRRQLADASAVNMF